MEVYEGMQLYYKNGDSVVVRYVTDRDIYVSYKGGMYIKPKESIGKKLFIDIPPVKKCDTGKEAYATRNITAKLKIKLDNGERYVITRRFKLTCADCILYKTQSCPGKQGICSAFKPGNPK